MTVEDLQALIEAFDWIDFQRTQDGHIHICVWRKSPHETIRFAYRIGLHMKRSMEAIMAKGNFIRMRAAPQYQNYELERLDPENLDQCLYTSYSANLNSHSRGWKPTIPSFSTGVYQPTQAQMQGMQQFQGLANQASVSVPPVVNESLIYTAYPSEGSGNLFSSMNQAMGSLGKAVNGWLYGNKI